MSTRIQIKVIPEKKDDFIYHKKLVSIELGCNPDEIYSINLLKRSIDARKRAIIYVLSYEVFFESVNTSETLSQTSYSDVSKAKNTVYIVGCGPAGLFAALKLIELGLKPIIYERGKKVRERRRDIANLTKKHKLNDLIIFNDFSKEIKKTKEMNLILKKFHAINSILILDKSSKNNIDKAVRNIPNVKCTDINHFSAFDIVKYKKIIFTESSLKELEKRYN